MLPTKFSPRGDGVWLGVMADLVRRRKWGTQVRTGTLRGRRPGSVFLGTSAQWWEWVSRAGPWPLRRALCPSHALPDAQRMGWVGVPHSAPVPPWAWTLAPAAGPASPPSCSLPAGRRGPGLLARPPVRAAPSPAPSTVSRLMAPVSRRLLRTPSVRPCLRSPLPHRPVTCSAAQPGAQSPGAR